MRPTGERAQAVRRVPFIRRRNDEVPARANDPKKLAETIDRIGDVFDHVIEDYEVLTHRFELLQPIAIQIDDAIRSLQRGV